MESSITITSEMTTAHYEHLTIYRRQFNIFQYMLTSLFMKNKDSPTDTSAKLYSNTSYMHTVKRWSFMDTNIFKVHAGGASSVVLCMIEHYMLHRYLNFSTIWNLLINCKLYVVFQMLIYIWIIKNT